MGPLSLRLVAALCCQLLAFGANAQAPDQTSISGTLIPYLQSLWQTIGARGEESGF